MRKKFFTNIPCSKLGYIDFHSEHNVANFVFILDSHADGIYRYSITFMKAHNWNKSDIKDMNQIEDVKTFTVIKSTCRYSKFFFLLFFGLSKALAKLINYRTKVKQGGKL